MSYFAHSDDLPAWASGVPDDWGREWLKWSAQLRTDRPDEDAQEVLPYISNEDIESWTGKLLTDEPKPSDSDGRMFKTGDVLFNKLRPYLAKVHEAEFDGVSSGELLCLRPSPEVLPRFLFYVLSSEGFIDTVNAESFGTKMPRADWETVGHQPLPLPPLATQRRIAGYLDEKTRQIDGLLAAKRALLDRLAEKRQSLITRAVTRGLAPEAPMKASGVDCPGEVPAHWEVKELRRVREYITSGSRGWAAFYADDGDPFLRMTNVTSEGIELDLTDLRFVDLDGEVEGTRTSVRAGDVLITITAELGAVAVVREDAEGAYINQHLALFRADQRKCDPDFLACFLTTGLARAQLEMSGQGGAKQGLGFEQVNSVLAAFPPLKEQQEIGSHCEAVWKDSLTLRESIEQSIEALTEYRTALVTAAVTGQIDGLR